MAFPDDLRGQNICYAPDLFAKDSTKTLPLEIWKQITPFFNFRDYATSSLVSKEWNNIIENTQIYPVAASRFDINPSEESNYKILLSKQISHDLLIAQIYDKLKSAKDFAYKKEDFLNPLNWHITELSSAQIRLCGLGLRKTEKWLLDLEKNIQQNDYWANSKTVYNNIFNLLVKHELPQEALYFFFNHLDKKIERIIPVDDFIHMLCKKGMLNEALSVYNVCAAQQGISKSTQVLGLGALNYKQEDIVSTLTESVNQWIHNHWSLLTQEEKNALMHILDLCHKQPEKLCHEMGQFIKDNPKFFFDINFQDNNFGSEEFIYLILSYLNQQCNAQEVQTDILNNIHKDLKPIFKPTIAFLCATGWLDENIKTFFLKIDRDIDIGNELLLHSTKKKKWNLIRDLMEALIISYYEKDQIHETAILIDNYLKNVEKNPVMKNHTSDSFFKRIPKIFCSVLEYWINQILKDLDAPFNDTLTANIESRSLQFEWQWQQNEDPKITNTFWLNGPKYTRYYPESILHYIFNKFGDKSGERFLIDYISAPFLPILSIMIGFKSFSILPNIVQVFEKILEESNVDEELLCFAFKFQHEIPNKLIFQLIDKCPLISSTTFQFAQKQDMSNDIILLLQNKNKSLHKQSDGKQCALM